MDLRQNMVGDAKSCSAGPVAPSDTARNSVLSAKSMTPAIWRTSTTMDVSLRFKDFKHCTSGIFCTMINQ